MCVILFCDKSSISIIGLLTNDLDLEGPSQKWNLPSHVNLFYYNTDFQNKKI